MDRQIVCFAVPSFEIAVARLHDPTLRTRPLAIAPLVTPRALLREVSPEAEQDGLFVGMPIEQARRWCPTLHVLPSNPSRMQRADQSLRSVVTRYTPVWEPSQPGSFLMDVTGTAKIFGPAYDVAANIQRDVLTHYQLEGTAGVGSNKLVAQTAANLVGPSQLYDVRPGSEQVFMSPLPIRILLGLHRPCMRPILNRLDDLNLLTLGDIAGSPIDALALVLGDYARQLSRWAQGIDHVPVLPPTGQPRLEETVVIEPDEIDDTTLWGRLQDILQRLCRTLRSQRRVCSRLSLTIRYSDQVDVVKQDRIQPETCWETDLSPLLSSLFQRCFRRRIRLCRMTLCLTGLTAYAEQGSLFNDQPLEHQRRQERAKNLAIALDTLHARFGEQAIRYGRSH